jgi:hypothetical protein
VIEGLRMSGFIEEADRNQGTLLPERVEEYVSEENPVRVIDAFIGELGLEKLSFKGMEPKSTSRPGYHPATMLKIDARVNVAYLASLLWHCFEGSEWARRYFEFVKAQMRKTLMHSDCRRTSTEIFNRWSREERLRWNLIFN